MRIQTSWSRPGRRDASLRSRRPARPVLPSVTASPLPPHLLLHVDVVADHPAKDSADAAPIRPPFTLSRLVVAPMIAPAAAPIAASRSVCFTVVGRRRRRVVPTAGARPARAPGRTTYDARDRLSGGGLKGTRRVLLRVTRLRSATRTAARCTAGPATPEQDRSSARRRSRASCSVRMPRSGHGRRDDEHPGQFSHRNLRRRSSSQLHTGRWHAPFRALTDR